MDQYRLDKISIENLVGKVKFTPKPGSDEEVADTYPNFFLYNHIPAPIEDWVVGKEKFVHLYYKLTRRPGLGQRRYRCLRKKVTVGWLDA